MPIEVPPIKQGKLFELLFQELTKLTDLFPDIPVVQEHWNVIFNYCVAPFINTIRDVNRLLNLLQYKFCGISSDIDFSDMVAISVIELFLPKVYKWIKQNKNVLVGLDTGMNLLGKKESIDECKDKYSKEISTLLNNTNQYNAKSVMQCLTMLFPPFAKKTGYIFTQIDRRESRKHNYIYNEVKFDRYFSVDIDDVGIKSALVEKSIYSNSIPELNQLFLAANSNESITGCSFRATFNTFYAKNFILIKFWAGSQSSRSVFCWIVKQISRKTIWVTSGYNFTKTTTYIGFFDNSYLSIIPDNSTCYICL